MDKRLFQRTTVEREVECEIDGVRDFVFLYNLSVSGCMVEISSGLTAIGSQVTFHFAGLTGIDGRIVWSVDGNTGIQFENLIPDSIVNYLGFDAGPLSFTEALPRDRYGSPLAIN